MNVVALIGNVATEPELRYTPSDRAVCTFRLAVHRSGTEQADMFTIVTWERQAEVCKEYLVHGRRVGLEGRIHHTPDGIEIVASRVELLGSKSGSPPVLA